MTAFVIVLSYRVRTLLTLFMACQWVNELLFMWGVSANGEFQAVSNKYHYV